MGRKAIDLTGKRFGKLTVISRKENIGNSAAWLCQCDCGNKTVVDGKKLGDIKNSIVYPVRNNIKRDFLIPSLAYFYNVLLNIAETYSKGVKDSDSMMYEFLRKSTEY